jgi:two-component system sensor histidine kinase UhpB
MPRLSLRWRLNLTFAAVLALLLGLDLALTVLGAGRRIDPEIANATALTSGIFREAIRTLSPAPDVAGQLEQLAASLDKLRHVRVTFQPEGAAPVAPPEMRTEAPAWFVGLVRPHATEESIDATVGGRRVGTILVEGDPADEIDELWDSLATLALDGGASAVVGFAVVYFVVNAALRPLDRLNAGLAALSRRDYTTRLGEGAAPEFAPLLSRFNALGDSLAAAETENRRLRARLVSIQDEERKEIARELHDEIGPHLFAARAQAGAARRAAPDGRVSEALDALIDVIDALQVTNRRILDRLRPAALEELGLIAALTALGRFFERNQPGLSVTVETAPIPALPASVEAALYRVAQEALTNAARHSGADEVRLGLQVEDEALFLSVDDNGSGLDPTQPAGRGLIGMRERVAAFGGVLELHAAVPHGLSVRAMFPMGDLEHLAS